MKKRSKAREIALQILYGLSKNEKKISEIFEESFFEKTSEKHREYAKELVEGCLQFEGELDKIISKISKNWDMKRMAALDHVLLKMALFEVIHRQDIPNVVSINEVIDLSKKFSTEDSGRFINGILDHYLKTNESKRDS